MKNCFIVIAIFLISSCGRPDQSSDTKTLNVPKTSAADLPLSAPSKNNIRVVNSGFYLGKTITSKNETLYLACDKIDSSNKEFWNNYYREARTIARYFKVAASHDPTTMKTKFAFGEQQYDYVKDVLRYEKQKYDRVLDYLASENDKRKGSSYSNYFERLFEDVYQGLAGFSWVFELGKFSTFVKDHYVVYASDQPITHKLTNKDYVEGRKFSDNFGFILLSFGMFDYENLPVVTHYGIQRNVEQFLAPINSFQGISLIAHGFAAAVSLNFLKDKKYMATSPIGKMGEILKSKLAPELVWINKFPDELQKLIDNKKWTLPTMGNERVIVSLQELEKLYKL